MNRRRDELRRDTHKDPAELEREIDATRAELRETLEELEHRLSPTDILEQVMSRVRRDGGAFAGNLGQSVKENPVPALLTSIGIAWMMAANGRHHNGHSTSASSGLHESKSRMGESAGRMRESAGRMRESAGRMKDRLRSAKEAAKHSGESALEGLSGTRSRVSDSISDSAESMRQRAHRASSVARRGAGRARSGMDYLWHEQPLILGAIGLAAGAIAGAAMRPTEQEDEMLGAMRDRSLERAKAAGMDSARHTRERVQHAASQVKDTLKDTLMSEDDESREGSSSSSSSPDEHRSPLQNRDPRVEPNAPESPSSTSSPGTGLGY